MQDTMMADAILVIFTGEDKNSTNNTDSISCYMC